MGARARIITARTGLSKTVYGGKQLNGVWHQEHGVFMKKEENGGWGATGIHNLFLRRGEGAFIPWTEPTNWGWLSVQFIGIQLLE